MLPCLSTGQRRKRMATNEQRFKSDQYSDTARSMVRSWWDQAMSSRLNSMATGSKVIIMQRLHETDLSGHVLERGNYEHLCLPSEFEPERRSVTSIGWRDPRTQPGELLFPEVRQPEDRRELRSGNRLAPQSRRRSTRVS